MSDSAVTKTSKPRSWWKLLLLAPLGWVAFFELWFLFDEINFSADVPPQVITGIMLGVVFSYAGTIILGVPARLILRAMDRTNLASFLTAGGIGGFLFDAILGNVFYSVGVVDWLGRYLEWRFLAVTLQTTLTGVAVGATYWFLARSDRKAA